MHANKHVGLWWGASGHKWGWAPSGCLSPCNEHPKKPQTSQKALKPTKKTFKLAKKNLQTCQRLPAAPALPQGRTGCSPHPCAFLASVLLISSLAPSQALRDPPRGLRICSRFRNHGADGRVRAVGPSPSISPPHHPAWVPTGAPAWVPPAVAWGRLLVTAPHLLVGGVFLPSPPLPPSPSRCVCREIVIG